MFVCDVARPAANRRPPRQDVTYRKADGTGFHDAEGPGEEGRPEVGQGAHGLLVDIC